MDLDVWVPMPGEARNGVEIPSAALIWKGGMPWVYMKIASDTFQRCAVENAFDQSDRWFIPRVPRSECRNRGQRRPNAIVARVPLANSG